MSALSLRIQERNEKLCQQCHLGYKREMRNYVSSVTKDVRGKQEFVSAFSLRIQERNEKLSQHCHLG